MNTSLHVIFAHIAIMYEQCIWCSRKPIQVESAKLANYSWIIFRSLDSAGRIWHKSWITSYECWFRLETHNSHTETNEKNDKKMIFIIFAVHVTLESLIFMQMSAHVNSSAACKSNGSNMARMCCHLFSVVLKRGTNANVFNWFGPSVLASLARSRRIVVRYFW